MKHKLKTKWKIECLKKLILTLKILGVDQILLLTSTGNLWLEFLTFRQFFLVNLFENIILCQTSALRLRTSQPHFFKFHPMCPLLKNVDLKKAFCEVRHSMVYGLVFFHSFRDFQRDSRPRENFLCIRDFHM